MAEGSYTYFVNLAQRQRCALCAVLGQ